MNLPAEFEQTIREVHGDAGRKWLAEVPSLLSDVAEHWGLVLADPYPNLSYNLVIPASRNGAPVVVKAGVPSEEFLCEIAALEVYGGAGAVLLLDSDPGRGLMLLERLSPGQMLSEIENDDEATQIAAELLSRLWRPAPAGPFPDLGERTRGIERIRPHFGGPGPFPEGLLGRVEQTREELLTAAPDTVLLHGDLHHFNILSATGSPWLAIDPKGIVGERAFEIAAFLVNPEPKPADVIERRIDILCEHLSLDRHRVIGWAMVFGVLSAWWTWEDHGHIGEEAIAFAHQIARLSLGLLPSAF